MYHSENIVVGVDVVKIQEAFEVSGKVGRVKWKTLPPTLTLRWPMRLDAASRLRRRYHGRVSLKSVGIYERPCVLPPVDLTFNHLSLGNYRGSTLECHCARQPNRLGSPREPSLTAESRQNCDLSKN